jgi:AcrR family transcriptional regulator
MTPPSASPGTGIRAISRRAVHAEITAHAMRLFEEQGFEATTVEQIAVAAGISSRSFFRYFPAKEDVVIGDPRAPGEFIRSTLESRPANEAAGAALRNALLALSDTVRADPDFALQSSRLMLSTPGLRARHLEKQLLWQRLLVPETVRRLEPVDPDLRDLTAHALVSSALGCFDVAVLQWAARELTDATAAARPQTPAQVISDRRGNDPTA